MIVGIGTDVVEVARLERAVQRWGHAFIGHLFTPAEVAHCEGSSRCIESYASRFAAKEAFLKALGTGGRDGISWQDMEVVPDARGRPELGLKGGALRAARGLGVERMFVSLSHTRGMATAVAVLEGIEERTLEQL